MTAPQAARAPKLPRSADYNVGHASSQPVAEDIVVRQATVYEDPGFATSEPSLNAQESAFFKDRGYLVKRGLIDDSQTFRRVVDHVTFARMWRLPKTPCGTTGRSDRRRNNAPRMSWFPDSAGFAAS